jgi:hypothetical protein
VVGRLAVWSTSKSTSAGFVDALTHPWKLSTAGDVVAVDAKGMAVVAPDAAEKSGNDSTQSTATRRYLRSMVIDHSSTPRGGRR